MGVAFRGFDEVDYFIWNVDKKVSEYDVLLNKIGFRIANEAIPDHFAKKESPKGEPWKALNPEYQDLKIKKKGTADILVYEGKLKDSVGYKAQGAKLFVGAGNEDVPQARLHNEGGEAGRNHSVEMPKREFVGFGKQEGNIINDSIQWWIGAIW